MSIPPLTRSIGSTERALRTLLERELSREHLSFAQWTALVFSSTTPVSAAEIAQRQLAGHVVTSESEARHAVDSLLSSGVLTCTSSGLLQHTEKGHNLFSNLSKSVEHITANVLANLPESDLETTHRTLLEIAHRAGSLLAVR